MNTSPASLLLVVYQQYGYIISCTVMLQYTVESKSEDVGDSFLRTPGRQVSESIQGPSSSINQHRARRRRRKPQHQQTPSTTRLDSNGQETYVYPITSFHPHHDSSSGKKEERKKKSTRLREPTTENKTQSQRSRRRDQYTSPEKEGEGGKKSEEKQFR